MFTLETETGVHYQQQNQFQDWEMRDVILLPKNSLAKNHQVHQKQIITVSDELVFVQWSKCQRDATRIHLFFHLSVFLLHINFNCDKLGTPFYDNYSFTYFRKKGYLHFFGNKYHQFYIGTHKNFTSKYVS